MVSKTTIVGSIPTAPAIKNRGPILLNEWQNYAIISGKMDKKISIEPKITSAIARLPVIEETLGSKETGKESVSSEQISTKTDEESAITGAKIEEQIASEKAFLSFIDERANSLFLGVPLVDKEEWIDIGFSGIRTTIDDWEDKTISEELIEEITMQLQQQRKNIIDYLEQMLTEGSNLKQAQEGAKYLFNKIEHYEIDQFFKDNNKTLPIENISEREIQSIYNLV